MKVNLQVKKIIALSLVSSLILFVGYAMFTGKVVPAEFMAVTTMVVGYYFGRGNIPEENGPK